MAIAFFIFGGIILIVGIVFFILYLKSKSKLNNLNAPSLQNVIEKTNLYETAAKMAEESAKMQLNASDTVKEAIKEKTRLQAEAVKEVFNDSNIVIAKSDDNANEQSVFCTECGAKNPVDAKFCKNCGKKLK